MLGWIYLGPYGIVDWDEGSLQRDNAGPVRWECASCRETFFVYSLDNNGLTPPDICLNIGCPNSKE